MSYTSQQLDVAVESLFHKFDKDKNQYLDPHQFKEFVRSTYAKMGKSNPTNTEIANIIELADKNYDGKIQREQLREMLIKTLGIKLK